MKKYNLMRCILIIILTGFISGCNGSLNDDKLVKIKVNPLGITGSGGNFNKLNIGIDKNNIPQKCKVYKVKAPKIDINQIKEKANKLGIEGKLTEDKKIIRVRGETGDLIVDKITGSERYFTKQMRGDVEPKPIKNILKDEEYVKLASDFLNKYGFSKPNIVLKGVNKGYRIGTVDKQGNETQSVAKVEVMFESKPVDGIKYTGIGPKISVWFGDNGEIIGYSSIWREIEEVGNYPLISIDEAVENIKKGKALIYNLSNSDEEGTIESWELVLWSDPDGYEQKYVIPHYIFKGKTKDGRVFTIVTRAISNTYIEESKS
ncbi:hypothetical protein [Thermobrachium celere]|uniref:Lipoprotein n=1 Tax=Thermobrachium celere DSM 8682 TaxID=941824 RepID=R7RTB6_9CLOT|nr:hypothetical protein [Thermobrachium celere]CDF58636.1 predicted protein [Thermobrachium celere DSM 8682]